MRFLGAAYPITTHPRGFLHTQEGVNQIKSDLLVLLFTNPGERVMLPDFGTPLRELIFEQNDTVTAQKARQMIIDSIRTWEPRITIEQLTVSTSAPSSSLNPQDDGSETDKILYINIKFFDPENIKDVQDLKLEIPLSGG